MVKILYILLLLLFFGYFIDTEVFKSKGLNLANSGRETWIIAIL